MVFDLVNEVEASLLSLFESISRILVSLAKVFCPRSGWMNRISKSTGLSLDAIESTFFFARTFHGLSVAAVGVS